MPTARLELAQLSPLPPQDSVSTISPRRRRMRRFAMRMARSGSGIGLTRFPALTPVFRRGATAHFALAQYRHCARRNASLSEGTAPAPNRLADARAAWRDRDHGRSQRPPDRREAATHRARTRPPAGRTPRSLPKKASASVARRRPSRTPRSSATGSSRPVAPNRLPGAAAEGAHVGALPCWTSTRPTITSAAMIWSSDPAGCGHPFVVRDSEDPRKAAPVARQMATKSAAFNEAPHRSGRHRRPGKQRGRIVGLDAAAVEDLHVAGLYGR